MANKYEAETMSELHPFTKEPAFVNREDELAYLQTWISAKPENILFLYGPKSSGKNTLVYRFIDQNLSKGRYDWLSNLDAYSKIDRFALSDGQKQAIWDFFGGSCWEISDDLTANSERRHDN
jgi:predicted AAA+ superfamily ATPase